MHFVEITNWGHSPDREKRDTCPGIDGPHCWRRLLSSLRHPCSPAFDEENHVLECAAQIKFFFYFTESESVTENAVGAPPGSPVIRRISQLKSGSKPSIVAPLENMEVNHGENVTLQVNKLLS